MIPQRVGCGVGFFLNDPFRFGGMWATYCFMILKGFARWQNLLLLGCAWVLTSCGSSPPPSQGDYYQPSSSAAAKSASELYREVNVKKDYIPRGRYGRRVRRYMRPRYITIHSTQNYTAGAWQHSKALRNGRLRARKRPGGNRIGFLTWHYTVDDGVAVQHLPTYEQGEHADFDGPGNNYSIAIEMCENRGNSRAATIERTAKLSAWLMYKYNIPLRNVVPHYHWRRRGISPEHKNCPHFLMTNGRPGAKWRWFLAKVNRYYRSISSGSVSSSVPVVSVPEREPTPVARYQPAPVRPSPQTYASRPRYHIVRRGETLYSISQLYGTTVIDLQQANGLRNYILGVGQRLRIP